MPETSVFCMRPGASLTSILLNIPCLTHVSKSSSLGILMDAYDYERLRARAMGDNGDQKDHALVMAFDELRRQGVIRLIDYAQFYSEDTQLQYLQQNQTLLEHHSEAIHRQAARNGIASWTGYARGQYQESFRTGLGEDGDNFTQLRRQEQNLRQAIKRGTKDPVQWNEKLLNKAVAALEVRKVADATFECNVERVIAGSEHQILNYFLETDKSPTNGTSTSDHIADHLKELNPSSRIAGITPTLASQTRGTLEKIGEIAVDISGVQYEDWVVLGPTFALPQYYGLFEDFSLIQREIRRKDRDQLADETKTVLTTLEHRDDQQLSSKLQYQADWVAEQTETLKINIDQPPLVETVGYAVSLSNYSRELRALAERDELSKAAIFLGASMASNPVARYQDTDIAWRAQEFINRIDPPAIEGQDIEQFRQERSAQTWDDHTDWYEDSDRIR